MKTLFRIANYLVIFSMIAAGCSPPGSQAKLTNDPPASRSTNTAVQPDTPTPFQPQPTATTTPTPTVPPQRPVWIPEWIPAAIISHVQLTDPFVWAEGESDSAIRLGFSYGQDVDFRWVYALVAPFATVSDGISGDELRSIWSSLPNPGKTILVDQETAELFTQKWGEPSADTVRLIDSSQMLEAAWAEKNTLAIIPFEQISPRWKVMRVDGQSPLDKNLDTSRYPLSLDFSWEGRIPLGQDKVAELREMVGTSTNRDEGKMTRILLTGVTALVRSTAERIETMGINYPIEEILPWLLDADFTHISNEISFNSSCPPAVPVRAGTQFCSNPEYMELLKLIDADVIELTGNHLLDYGREPFENTLQMYREADIAYYAGGINVQEAMQPLIIEHNGNRIAMIGCNRAGPSTVWATADSSGAAPCDLEWMAGEIQRLAEEGILSIVTFQHYELEDFMPINLARQEMQKMAEAGAVVVSGSQAHVPHGFAFVGNNFVHYGLGNLFFDQMWPNHQREFLDRHTFYDGKYLGVELLTAKLEDYSQPRLMTVEERTQFLTTYFDVSGLDISD